MSRVGVSNGGPALPAFPQVEVFKTSTKAIPSARLSVSITGVETHVVCQSYTDRICVFVSQVGKIGCLIQATVTTPAHHQPVNSAYLDDESSLPASSAIRPILPSTALQPLLGTPPPGCQTLYPLYASHIASTVMGVLSRGTSSRQTGHSDGTGASVTDARPIIVGLGLRSLSSKLSNAKEEEEEDAEMTEEERTRFLEILEMVAKAAEQVL